MKRKVAIELKEITREVKIGGASPAAESALVSLTFAVFPGRERSSRARNP
jgi:hypothetical protein